MYLTANSVLLITLINIFLSVACVYNQDETNTENIKALKLTPITTTTMVSNWFQTSEKTETTKLLKPTETTETAESTETTESIETTETTKPTETTSTDRKEKSIKVGTKDKPNLNQLFLLNYQEFQDLNPNILLNCSKKAKFPKVDPNLNWGLNPSNIKRLLKSGAIDEDNYEDIYLKISMERKLDCKNWISDIEDTNDSKDDNKPNTTTEETEKEDENSDEESTVGLFDSLEVLNIPNRLGKRLNGIKSIKGIQSICYIRTPLSALNGAIESLIKYLKKQQKKRPKKRKLIKKLTKKNTTLYKDCRCDGFYEDLTFVGQSVKTLESVFITTKQVIRLLDSAMISPLGDLCENGQGQLAEKIASDVLPLDLIG
ncbi:uncharacterized protein LOC128957957 [Oppia nitens]|uniref:uncharacterized protein LOC128957957 n=1 Tax=Oppia nitens TaxID=1686743 RepID=UPI0023DA80E8|nr:uncharacterized protein LOC128957957 [Oppia nitens]